jgi:hypothetical protein
LFAMTTALDVRVACTVADVLEELRDVAVGKWHAIGVVLDRVMTVESPEVARAYEHRVIARLATVRGIAVRARVSTCPFRACLYPTHHPNVYAAMRTTDAQTTWIALYKPGADVPEPMTGVVLGDGSLVPGLSPIGCDCKDTVGVGHRLGVAFATGKASLRRAEVGPFVTQLQWLAWYGVGLQLLPPCPGRSAQEAAAWLVPLVPEARSVMRRVVNYVVPYCGAAWGPCLADWCSCSLNPPGVVRGLVAHGLIDDRHGCLTVPIMHSRARLYCICNGQKTPVQLADAAVADRQRLARLFPDWLLLTDIIDTLAATHHVRLRSARALLTLLLERGEFVQAPHGDWLYGKHVAACEPPSPHPRLLYVAVSDATVKASVASYRKDTLTVLRGCLASTALAYIPTRSDIVVPPILIDSIAAMFIKGGTVVLHAANLYGRCVGWVGLCFKEKENTPVVGDSSCVRPATRTCRITEFRDQLSYASASTRRAVMCDYLDYVDNVVCRALLASLY